MRDDTFNPFESPKERPSNSIDAEDFRDDAVRESQRLIGSQPVPPQDQSYILSAPDFQPSSLALIGRVTLCILVVGIGGIAAGGGLAMMAEKLEGDYFELIIALGVLIAVAGIGVLISATSIIRWTVRRQLGSRYDELLFSAGGKKLLCVNIEDAATFSKMKLTPEDMGYLLIDQERRMLLIEGIRFRYRIHGRDAVHIAQIMGSTQTGAAVTVKIGSITVRLALQHDSIRHELKRQSGVTSKDCILERIQDALANDD